jgi:hypothetical protein
MHHELGCFLGRRRFGERDEMSGLREPIHHCQNDGVDIRRGSPVTKSRDMRPGTMREGQKKTM